MSTIFTAVDKGCRYFITADDENSARVELEKAKKIGQSAVVRLATAEEITRVRWTIMASGVVQELDG